MDVTIDLADFDAHPPQISRRSVGGPGPVGPWPGGNGIDRMPAPGTFLACGRGRCGGLCRLPATFSPQAGVMEVSASA